MRESLILWWAFGFMTVKSRIWWAFLTGTAIRYRELALTSTVRMREVPIASSQCGLTIPPSRIRN